MLGERGIDGSYKTVRRCLLKFGTIIAHRPRQDGIDRTGGDI
jgi:transposase-like protein